MTQVIPSSWDGRVKDGGLLEGSAEGERKTEGPLLLQNCIVYQTGSRFTHYIIIVANDDGGERKTDNGYVGLL